MEARCTTGVLPSRFPSSLPASPVRSVCTLHTTRHAHLARRDTPHKRGTGTNQTEVRVSVSRCSQSVSQVGGKQTRTQSINGTFQPEAPIFFQLHLVLKRCCLLLRSPTFKAGRQETLVGRRLPRNLSGSDTLPASNSTAFHHDRSFFAPSAAHDDVPPPPPHPTDPSPHSLHIHLLPLLTSSQQTITQSHVCPFHRTHSAVKVLLIPIAPFAQTLSVPRLR